MPVSVAEFFREEERKRIREALAAAGQRTAARIVPVVVARSSRYDRAGDLLGIYLALLVSLSLLWLYPDARVPLYGLLPVQLAAFLAGTLGLARIQRLRFFMAGRALMNQRVRQAAEEYFTRFALESDAERPGVLIYYSLFEQQVVVLGGAPVLAKVRPEAWEEVRNIILKGLFEKEAGAGLCRGIERGAELLSAPFPRPGSTQDAHPAAPAAPTPSETQAEA